MHKITHPLKPKPTSLALMFSISAMLVATDRGVAAVVIGFSQAGTSVVARTSGSIDTPPATLFIAGGTTLEGSEISLYYERGSDFFTDGGLDFHAAEGGVGMAFNSGLSIRPSSASGESFGFRGDILYWTPSGTSNSSVTPITVWTWDNTTIEEMGLDYLATTPTLVWAGNYGSGNTISYALVPEPCVVLNTVLSVGLLAVRRRRNSALPS